jgi:ADP-heptose:LPS heptosyltransferase
MSAAAEPLASAGRVLVIKHGALGDLVQSLGAMAAIRRHHPAAPITLLTTAPFAEFTGRCPFLDEVWVDQRPGLSDPLGLLRLRRRLRGAGFARVYDLQTSDRSSGYFRLMGPGGRPEWSGIAPGCSHPHSNPDRDRQHTLERLAEQLRMAGIPHVPEPDLSWAEEPVTGFDAARRFALLVPGGSAHRPEKRWPVASYAALAAGLAAEGVLPVVIGGAPEQPLAAAVRAACPTALDLTGRTGFGQIAWLGARAAWAIGNDTGPVHLIAVAGAPVTVLYSAASDPALTRPWGARVTVLRRESLAELQVAEVAGTVALR